jgi:hypothetical protein
MSWGRAPGIAEQSNCLLANMVIDGYFNGWLVNRSYGNMVIDGNSKSNHQWLFSKYIASNSNILCFIAIFFAVVKRCFIVVLIFTTNGLIIAEILTK